MKIIFYSIQANIFSHKTKLVFLLLGVFLNLCSFGQDLKIPDHPIYEALDQGKLKRGIYVTFNDFLANEPSVVDSFIVEKIPREQFTWRGTFQSVPRYASNNRKVKKVWGFSDGDSAYVFHEIECFTVIIEGEDLVSYGYDEFNHAGGQLAAAVGGMIGSSIYAVNETSKIKNRKVKFIIDPYLGDVLSDAKLDLISTGPPTPYKFVVYRRSKKEADKQAEFLVDDSLKYSFEQKSYVLLGFVKSDTTTTICTGMDFKECITIDLNADEITYVECTMEEGSEFPKLIGQDTSQGEFDFYKIERAQDKRGKQIPEIYNP